MHDYAQPIHAKFTQNLAAGGVESGDPSTPNNMTDNHSPSSLYADRLGSSRFVCSYSLHALSRSCPNHGPTVAVIATAAPVVTVVADAFVWAIQRRSQTI